MKLYIGLHFLPGAAGNFISRCINLLDNTYVWAGDTVPQTLEEKSKLLSYKECKGYVEAKRKRSWIEFENSITQYYNIQKHCDIDDNAVAVVVGHPRITNAIKLFAGPKDSYLNIYVDPRSRLDWVILNGHNKHSYPESYWFDWADRLANDPTVYKINLEEIINGYDRFYIEFKKLSDLINRSITDEINAALHTLYNDWFLTTLRDDAFRIQKEEKTKFFKRIVNALESN